MSVGVRSLHAPRQAWSLLVLAAVTCVGCEPADVGTVTVPAGAKEATTPPPPTKAGKKSTRGPYDRMPRGADQVKPPV